jgi:hypothetical protein
MAHFFEQFTGPMTAWWADLGAPDMKKRELQEKVSKGVEEEAAGRSFEELSRERDQLLLGLLRLVSGKRHE